MEPSSHRQGQEQQLDMTERQAWQQDHLYLCLHSLRGLVHLDAKMATYADTSKPTNSKCATISIFLECCKMLHSFP